jgi:hypothetical protein
MDQRNSTGPEAPAEVRTLQIRAREAGLEPGTPEYQQFMLQGGAPSDPDVSAKEEQIDRLMETGLERDVAINIVDGRFTISRDPVNGTAQVVDKATGQVVQAVPSQRPGGNQPSTDQTQEAPQAQEDLNFGPDVPDANFPGAFGAQGFGANVANTFADTLGMNMPAPEINEAQTAVRNLGTQTVTLLQESFPGRASNMLMERLQELTARPGRIVEGSGAALDTMRQTREMLDGLREIEERKIENPRAYTPQMRAQAQNNIDQIESLMGQYDGILRQMEPQGGGENTTSSGVNWSIKRQ